MPKVTPENTETTPEVIPERLPVLPLRDVVIFPYMIFPILIGRENSITAVNQSLEQDKYIALLTQKVPDEDFPTEESLYKVGTLARIIQVLKLPNGLMKVLVDGLHLIRVTAFIPTDSFYNVEFKVEDQDVVPDIQLHALTRQVGSLFHEYVKLNRDLPGETLISFENIASPIRKLYFVASSLHIPVTTKQKIIEYPSIVDQYLELIRILTEEIEILNMEMDIDNRVQSNIQQSQRKFYLQEQIRVLQQELGSDAELPPDLAELKEKILKAGLPLEVKEKALEEFDKLKSMTPLSPEATVSRNYLDWVLAVPWNVHTPDVLDIESARTILDKDHYGLEKPKDRILEFIAVLNLVPEMRGQILCFVGPPGVGKTSLGRSIARALNRKFVRLSLGGIHDEAEIRGHRRTYIGSMPGKIVQALRKAGSMNPVILLDEIDKMSADFHGDPTAAMLEVLDPEQNCTFNDHYLDVDVDLSRVLFITTANVSYGIPEPLQDRMEIIEIPGYLEHEKIAIAQRHLVPRQIREHGLKGYDVRFQKRALRRLIREYTMEAGVRNLEREVATVCRKIAKEVVLKKLKPNRKRKSHRTISVTPESLDKYLGVSRYSDKHADRKPKIGIATGLAWTSMGGATLPVEVVVMKGQEKLTLTGQLGDVMKESAMAALSYLRANAETFNLPHDFNADHEIHIHLPEGSIPKDGPSAGITLTMALLSALSGVPTRGDVAMTGEITLRGEILPVGGLNEKLLAARRARIRTILIPGENKKDLVEIPAPVKENLNIIPITTIPEAIEHVFVRGSRAFARKKKS
ncbi:MAG: endopeptidase La [Chlorobi bacterium]|nr:endopeptidase La [Chlorobiota bacterium]